VTGVAPAAGRGVAAGIVAVEAGTAGFRMRVLDGTGRPLATAMVTVDYHAVVDR
jgi:hypothetical protein